MSHPIIARWVNKAFKSPERFLTVPPMFEKVVQDHLEKKGIPFKKSKVPPDFKVKFDFDLTEAEKAALPFTAGPPKRSQRTLERDRREAGVE